MWVKPHHPPRLSEPPQAPPGTVCALVWRLAFNTAETVKKHTLSEGEQLTLNNSLCLHL